VTCEEAFVPPFKIGRIPVTFVVKSIPPASIVFVTEPVSPVETSVPPTTGRLSVRIPDADVGHTRFSDPDGEEYFMLPPFEDVIVKLLALTLASLNARFTTRRLLMLDEELFTISAPETVRAVVDEKPTISFVVRKLLIVEEAAFTSKPPLTERFDTEKFVDVAFVVVPFVTERFAIVEDANTMIPPAPFGWMLTPSDDVAHFEFGCTQAAEPTAPDAMFKHPSARESIRRFDVDATPATVSAVEDAYVARKFVIVEEELLAINPPLKYESNDEVAAPSEAPPLNVCRAVNVFAVYVFGIVVDAAM
jgi:hypothetical protein